MRSSWLASFNPSNPLPILRLFFDPASTFLRYRFENPSIRFDNPSLRLRLSPCSSPALFRPIFDSHRTCPEPVPAMDRRRYEQHPKPSRRAPEGPSYYPFPLALPPDFKRQGSLKMNSRVQKNLFVQPHI